MIFEKENCLPEFREKLKYWDERQNELILAAKDCVREFIDLYFEKKCGKNIIMNYESFPATFGHFVDSNLGMFLTERIGENFCKTGGTDADIVGENGEKAEIKTSISNGVTKTSSNSNRLTISKNGYTRFSSHTNCANEGGIIKNVDSPYIVIQIAQPYDIFHNFIEDKFISLSRIYLGYFYHADFIGSTSSSYLPSEKYTTQGYDIYFDDTEWNNIQQQIDAYNANFPTVNEIKYKENLERFNSLTIYEKATLWQNDKQLHNYAYNHEWLNDPLIIEEKNRIVYNETLNKEADYVKVLIDYVRKHGSMIKFSDYEKSVYGYLRSHELLPETRQQAIQRHGNLCQLCEIAGRPIF